MSCINLDDSVVGFVVIGEGVVYVCLVGVEFGGVLGCVGSGIGLG